ncbi:Uncharacterized protein SCG7109_AG_00250 [Chlamydiales bacterium SCGC AG-110-M15]|nr:Uncharacterized protein SCG7109_AG_00250 [Chlamydiales bacterium SCGC AG-110-M15]
MGSMAGLAGVVYPDIFQTGSLLKGMLKLLEHRSPDSPQHHHYKNVEMGIRGGDIAHNFQKNVCVLIDGKIYNSQDLLKEIRSTGLSCPHDSPANVVIYAYEMWGLDFINKLNGSFAITLFDHRKNTLFLFRDRMGKKPLYWARHRGHFLFGSELKSILTTGVIPQTPANDALASYFFLGYIPQDMTPIQNINKLLPGYYLQYDLKGKMTVNAYWSYSSYFSEKTEDSEHEIEEKLHSLLSDAVKVRIPTEEDVGCFLGGGLGSASIAYYLSSEAKDRNIHAYSSYFDEQNIEDLKASQSVTSTLKLHHETASIKKDTLLDDLIRIIWYLDEPIADPNVIATWEQCKLAAHDTRTVFSGMGSDELLGGHQRYSMSTSHLSITELMSHLPNPLIRKFVVPILKQVSPRSAYSILRSFHTDPRKQQYVAEHAIFNDKALQRFSPLLSKHFSSEIFLQKFYQLIGLNRHLEAFLYFDVKTALADKYSLQYERLTAAHQLEWETPFFDHRLVEYLATIPESYKLSGQESGALLKTLMKNRLPHRFVHRKKVTRKSFLSPWIKSGELHKLLLTLDKGILVESGYLSPRAIQGLINNPYQHPYPFLALWSVLTLELWFQLFINRPVTTFPNDLTAFELLSGCRDEMRGFSTL